MTDACADYSVSAGNASSRGGIYMGKDIPTFVLMLNFLKNILKRITQKTYLSLFLLREQNSMVCNIVYVMYVHEVHGWV